MGDWKMVDTMIVDGLWDVYNQYHMGITAENVAKKYGIDRAKQSTPAAGGLIGRHGSSVMRARKLRHLKAMAVENTKPLSLRRVVMSRPRPEVSRSGRSAHALITKLINLRK